MADVKDKAEKPQMMVVVLHALICVDSKDYVMGAMVDGKELGDWLPMLMEQGAVAQAGM